MNLSTWTRVAWATVGMLVLQLGMIFLYHQWCDRYNYSNPVMRVGIVNMNRLEQCARPYQDLRHFLDREHTKIRKKVMNLEHDIRVQYDELKRLESANSSQVIELKRKIDQQASVIEQIVQREREHLNQIFTQKKVTLQNQVNACFKNLCQRYQLELLLNSNLDDENPIILHATHPFNVTDEAIRLLDTFDLNSK
jgi:Skp family chaperone for outer membrane proteins